MIMDIEDRLDEIIIGMACIGSQMLTMECLLDDSPTLPTRTTMSETIRATRMHLRKIEHDLSEIQTEIMKHGHEVK